MIQLTRLPLQIAPPKLLRNTLIASIDRLDVIIRGSTAKGSLYKSVVLKLKNNNFNIASPREARLALAALWQEQNMLEDIGNKRLQELVSAILDASNANIAKQLIRLFYAKFFVLEENKQAIIIIEAIRYYLKRYEYSNKFVVNIKNESAILQANFAWLLEKYSNKELAYIAKLYGMSANDEFYEQLRLSRLLTHFDTIGFGKNWSELFDETKNNKGRYARTINYRSIGEEAVSKLLLRCFKMNVLPCESWQDFILQTVGDPRTHANHNSWDRIGNELKDYFIKALSMGDLREFLESLSDGVGDSIYKFRKAFWMKYIDKVLNAKLLICPRELERLKWANSGMYSRIINNPSTYGRLASGNKSYIYIDFGTIKIIEGTHNSSIRFYSRMPVWFQKNEYDIHDKSDIENDRIIHNNSNDYVWQSNTAYILKKYGITTS